MIRRNRRNFALAGMVVCSAFSLWGCGKDTPINHAEPPLSAAETQRNEPPIRDADGKIKNEQPPKAIGNPTGDPRDVLR